MYLSDKILAFGVSGGGVPVVVIRTIDYPNDLMKQDTPMLRTTYVDTVQLALDLGIKHVFEYSSPPSSSRGYVAVPVERLRIYQPKWCITEDELLKQYELMQRDGVEPVDFDLRKEPELLLKAKELWTKRVAGFKTT